MLFVQKNSKGVFIEIKLNSISNLQRRFHWTEVVKITISVKGIFISSDRLELMVSQMS
jgi:hypothetical protein